VADTFQAVFTKMDMERRMCSLELYGYDFMIDEDFKIYLIEVNANPALDLPNPHLARMIPNVIENSLRYSIPFLN
jgi:hypothetical protein